MTARRTLRIGQVNTHAAAGGVERVTWNLLQACLSCTQFLVRNWDGDASARWLRKVLNA